MACWTWVVQSYGDADPLSKLWQGLCFERQGSLVVTYVPVAVSLQKWEGRSWKGHHYSIFPNCVLLRSLIICFQELQQDVCEFQRPEKCGYWPSFEFCIQSFKTYLYLIYVSYREKVLEAIYEMSKLLVQVHKLWNWCAALKVSAPSELITGKIVDLLSLSLVLFLWFMGLL